MTDTIAQMDAALCTVQRLINEAKPGGQKALKPILYLVTRALRLLHGEKAVRRLDLTGRVYGRLTTIESTESKQGSACIWKCSCSCGGTAFAASSDLRRGRRKSCGCLIKEGREGVGQFVAQARARKRGKIVAFRDVDFEEGLEDLSKL